MGYCEVQIQSFFDYIALSSNKRSRKKKSRHKHLHIRISLLFCVGGSHSGSRLPCLCSSLEVFNVFRIVTTDKAASQGQLSSFQLGDRLFVIPAPRWIGRLQRWTPTAWDESGLLRKVDHGEMINEPACELCKQKVSMYNGRKLPCGHIFHKHCISCFLDCHEKAPRCTDGCGKGTWKTLFFPDSKMEKEPRLWQCFGDWIWENCLSLAL